MQQEKEIMCTNIPISYFTNCNYKDLENKLKKHIQSIYLSDWGHCKLEDIEYITLGIICDREDAHKVKELNLLKIIENELL